MFKRISSIFVLGLSLTQSIFAASPQGTCGNVVSTPMAMGDCVDNRTCPPSNTVTTQANCPAPGSWTPHQSMVDNITYNFVHDAIDYSNVSSFTACSTCGGNASPGSDMPRLMIRRTHQFRNLSEIGSFGPGVFMEWDRYMSMYEVNGQTQIDYFEPANAAVKRYFQEGANFVESYLMTTAKMELFDANGDKLSQNHFANATHAEIITHSKKKVRFEFYSVDNFLKKARIVSFTDIRGFQIVLTYQHAADANVDYQEKTKIATITDANQRQLTFNYLAERKKGQYVVSSIQIPNGSSINYNYDEGTDGALNSIDYPDGTQSTFSVSSTADDYTKVSIFEATQDNIHRKKDAFLTNNFTNTAGQDGVFFYNSSSLLVNRIEKAGEVSYQTYTDPRSANGRLIYEGGKKLKYQNIKDAPMNTLNGLEVEPELFTQNKGYYDFPIVREKTFALASGSEADHFGGRMSQGRDKYGRSHTYEYTAGKGITKKTYADGSFEEFQRNEFQQETLEIDRLGRATVKEYDAVGNLTSKKVGYEVTNYSSSSQDTVSEFLFNETAGTSLVDELDLSLSGEITEGVTLAQPDSEGGNTAIHFDGTAVVTIPNDGRFDGNKLKVSFAFKPDWEVGEISHASALFFLGSTGSAARQSLFLSADKKQLLSWNSIKNGRHYYDFTEDRWYNLEITWENGTETLKVDGNLISTNTVPIGTSVLKTLKLGYGNGNEYYKGSIDNFKIESNRFANTPTIAQTAEYAEYRKEYYPVGHQNQHLLRYEWDANNNRKEYIYDSRNLLIQINEPDDEGQGYHAKVKYTYDSAARQISSEDAIGRITQFEYDNRDRMIKATYNDGSTELNIYGTGAEANLIVKKKDRNGNTTKFTYDEQGRAIETIKAYSVMAVDGSSEIVNDTETQSIETCEYLNATTLKTKCTIDGEVTEYEYDLRNRVIATTKYAANGVALITKTTYLNNLVFSKEDPYGRKTYYLYRDSDTQKIRTVKGLVPSFELADFTAVEALARDLQANADYLITDYELDEEGQKVATIDPRGIRHEMTYDSRGRNTQSTEAAGTAVAATSSTEFDANSNVTAQVSPRGLRTEVTYTRRNKVASKTEAAGTVDSATMFMTYLADGRQDLTTDYRGNILQKIWHLCCGRPQASIDQAGHGSITNNDFYGNITHIINVEDVASHSADYHNPIDAKTLREVTRLYDSRHRLIAETVWLQPLGYVDPNDVPIAGINGIPAEQGLTTTYTYFDSVTDYPPTLNNLLAELAADGTTFDVNSDGSAVLVTNPAGEMSVQIQDGLGRELSSAILDPNDTSVITWNTQKYDVLTADGLLETAQIDAIDHTKKSQSDAAGRIIKTIDTESNATLFSYDANSNRISFRDANGVGEDCVYDERNRDIQCTDTVGAITKREYDADNNIVKEIDAKSQESTYVFDNRNRKTSQTDRLNGTTKFTFDSNSNLVAIEDAQGSKTFYTFDSRNLQTEVQYPDHVIGSTVGTGDYGLTFVSYDALGRKSVTTDQLGDTVTYSYDLASRMTERSYSDNTVDTFTYDQASRVLTAHKGRYDNTVSYTYDLAGRRLSETQTHNVSTNPVSYTCSHTFDPANRVTSCTYPDGTVLNKTYTDRNLLEGITYQGNSVVDFIYDSGAREATRTFGNALVTTKSYNLDNTYASISTANKLDLDFTYSYDVNKNLTGESIAGTVLSPYSWTASFDSEDRLANWNRSNSDSRSYNLDLIGNWTSVTRNGVQETRSHNSVYELTSAGPDNFSYDAKGNLISKGSHLYTLDIDNHMQSLANSEVSFAEYSYDALGRRLSKTVNGVTITYVLCGKKVTAEYVNETLVTKYVWGSYIDDLIAQIDINDNIIYAHSDRQYNVRALSDSTGSLTQLYSYTPYGERTVLDSAGLVVADKALVSTVYGFTGRRYDSESGFWYFRARYFDSTMGRFVSRDPLSYIDGYGLYNGYFAERFNTDPTGKFSVNALKRRACKFACGALGALCCGAIGTACAGASTVTIGGVAIPCAIATKVVCGTAAGSAAVCIDWCGTTWPAAND